HDAGLAADIDDPAAALRNHQRHNTLTDAKLREEVDSHALDQLLIGHLEKGLVGAGAGVIDEDVDAAELVLDDVRNRPDLLELVHVEPSCLDLRLGSAHDVASRFGERLLPACADQNFDALACERMCGFEADALASTGDKRRLAWKPELHCLAPLKS